MKYNMFYSCQFLAPVFCTRKMVPETPFTQASFLAQETYDRNLRQKLASLNAALRIRAANTVYQLIPQISKRF